MSERERKEQSGDRALSEDGLDDFAAALDWRSFRATAGRDRVEGCPTPEQIAALSGGEEVPGRERETLLEHILRCSACRLEARAAFAGHEYVEQALAALAEPESQQASEGPARGDDVRRRWLWPAAAALLVALSAGLWLVQRGELPHVDSVLRTDQAPRALVPADGARLDRFPQRFAWPPRAGATAYRLRVVSDAGEVIWEAPPVDEARFETSAIELPPQLRRDGTYGWEVEVDGAVAERVLGTFWFEVSSGNGS